MTTNKKRNYFIWTLFIIFFATTFLCPISKFDKYGVIAVIGILVAIFGFWISTYYFRGKNKKDNHITSETKKNKKSNQIKSEINKDEKSEFEYLKDWIIVLLVFNIIFALILIFALLGLFRADEPKIEWFLALVSVIGIVGAIWAILARIDAKKAHEQAMAAKESADSAHDTAVKTYKSIAGAFQFSEILKLETEFMLYSHVNRENSDLILFLGFPAVGFFCRDDKFDWYDQSLNFCEHLTTKLYRLVAQESLGRIEIRFVCFSKELTKVYLDKTLKDQLISQGQYDAFVSIEKELHKALKDLKEKHPNNFKYAFLEKEIGLRFTISAVRDFNRESNEKCIVWVVSDFQPSNGLKTDIINFQSGGFKTVDPEIIKVLRELCKDYIEHPQTNFITRPY